MKYNIINIEKCLLCNDIRYDDNWGEYYCSLLNYFIKDLIENKKECIKNYKGDDI